jgi:hypothetical protein
MTPYQRSKLSTRFAASSEEFALIVEEGEFRGFDFSETPDRFFGFSDWMVFIPSQQRAAWVVNGDPIWFDSISLDDAINRVVNGDNLIS